MKITNKKLTEIMPYEKNPRNNEAAIDKVAASIKEFGFKQPIVIDAAGVIVVGHTRYLAAKKLGLEEVPCITADDLDPYQIKAYRLADNKVAEFSEWDFSLLDKELEEIGDFEMGDFKIDDLFNIDDDFIEEGGNDNSQLDTDKYTGKVNIPQYEITGEEPDISELCDTSKAQSLIKEIKEANIPQDIKEFLINASYRHLKFNYRNIAEFYANQTEEIQKLMEKSALVIIDYEDAIAYGYTELSSKIDELKEME